MAFDLSTASPINQESTSAGGFDISSATPVKEVERVEAVSTPDDTTVKAVPGSSPRARRASELNKKEQARRESFLSSLPEGQREILEDISGPEAFLIGMGKGFTTVGRGLGLADAATEREKEIYSALTELDPVSAKGGEILGESAPFVPIGVAASGLPVASALGRAAVTGGLGGLESGVIARGEGANALETIGAASLGAIAGGTLELALPSIRRSSGKLFRRITGKSPKTNIVDDAGIPTKEFQDALDESGISYADVLAESGVPSGSIDPEQMARQTFLKKQGIEPTRAQVTRDAADFQAQQEAAKTSGAVRDAIEGQEQVLSSRFDNVIKGSSGDLSTDTNTVIDAVTSKAEVLDKQISDLYKVAREASPDEKNIRFNSLAAKLKELAPANRRTGGNVEAIVGDLQAKGVLDKGMKLKGRIDTDTAEDVRQLMNELYDPSNAYGNTVLRDLKNSLDDDVFKAAGGDIYKEARKAKADFEKELSRAKISKFDSRKQNIVRDVLENKIDPDQMTDKVVFGKSWRADDLNQLKDYIGTSETGRQAFNDLRADTLQKIKDKAFIGPEDAQGMKALSRDKLERALGSIGDSKLKVLFSPEENKFLKDLVKVSKMREPVRGTQQGLGPSAQAVKTLTDQVKSNPLFRAIIDTITLDANNRAVLKASPKVKDITNLSPARTALAASAGASTSAVAEEE